MSPTFRLFLYKVAATHVWQTGVVYSP